MKEVDKRGGARTGAGRKPNQASVPAQDKSFGRMISLRPEEWRFADALAAAIGITRSELFRRAIQEIPLTGIPFIIAQFWIHAGTVLDREEARIIVDFALKNDLVHCDETGWSWKDAAYTPNPFWEPDDDSHRWLDILDLYAQAHEAAGKELRCTNWKIKKKKLI